MRVKEGARSRSFARKANSKIFARTQKGPAQSYRSRESYRLSLCTTFSHVFPVFLRYDMFFNVVFYCFGQRKVHANNSSWFQSENSRFVRVLFKIYVFSDKCCFRRYSARSAAIINRSCFQNTHPAYIYPQ